MNVLRLKKRESRRIEAGHLWVFSNEIDTAATPLKGLPAGEAVTLESATGKFLAHAYANPASLIAARITSRNKSKPFSRDLLQERLQTALQLRTALYKEPFYRLVHSEGDYLPGLVIDRYGDTLVVQITTAGMERFRDDIVAMLLELCKPTAICLKNDNTIRSLEGLPETVEWVHGQAPETLLISENGLDFVVPPALGQKTGWFYDHRENRAALRRWVAGKRVLDLYSYIGGFGINAAVGGASKVQCVDASGAAVKSVLVNAEHNGVADKVDATEADVVEFLRQMYNDNERYDVIALDPPAFIKRKKDKESGARHYALNMRLAMRLLYPNGILLSASCSQAYSLAELQQAMQSGMPKTASSVQILSTFQQAPDHPVNVAMPESLYLKGLIARLI